MQELAGRTAVITGAGSGIGRALAIACARHQMHLVLADVDARGLDETAELSSQPQCLRVLTDVSKPHEVEGLAQRAFGVASDVALLFNNAGVATGGWVWESTPQDWAWLIGVNLMGVAHGIHSFVPRMLKQGAPAHIVNTASAAGLISVPGAAAYCATKHGVVTVSECLRHELRQKKAAIGVSVLCPSFVQTGIVDSERHRPADLRGSGKAHVPRDENLMRGMRDATLTADDVARLTLDAVIAGEFYIVPHAAILEGVQQRLTAILQGHAPVAGVLA